MFKQYLGKFILVFVDDIIIYSWTCVEHIQPSNCFLTTKTTLFTFKIVYRTSIPKFHIWNIQFPYMELQLIHEKLQPWSNGQNQVLFMLYREF